MPQDTIDSQRLLKSDARSVGANQGPRHPAHLVRGRQYRQTVLGQYANRRSGTSVAPGGEMDSTEVIYLPTASGPWPRRSTAGSTPSTRTT
ncbi:MAG: hypothetical protein F9K35_03265 [Burkholderiaceae bacterium]|nr:MAG: hypothetical protein F9K35_03265 [Burkholderiaceae bacterium]